VLEFDTQKINLGLIRVNQVLSALGLPQNKFQSIHVAGTNGKGSVCAMLDSILREAGFKVGLYTSPHLFKFNERIKIQDQDISDRRLEMGIEKVKKAGEGLDLTTFEILTCVAFDYFAERKVDYAVVEVGMGGRLDATNVIIPLVSVITNIDYDHTEYLGNTLEQIALEKAGIIKPGVPVVTAENKPVALRVIRETCRLKGSRLWELGEGELNEPANEFAVKNLGENLFSPLIGPHQRLNEALAVKVAEILKLKEEAIEKGLKKTHWPGRFQIIAYDPLTIVDGAHNVAGAAALAETIREMKIKSPLTLVLGIQCYKNIAGMLNILGPLADPLIITCSSHPQAAPPAEIVMKIDKGRIIIIYSVAEAVEVARGFDQPAIITGSLFTVAEALNPEP